MFKMCIEKERDRQRVRERISKRQADKEKVWCITALSEYPLYTLTFLRTNFPPHIQPTNVVSNRKQKTEKEQEPLLYLV